MQRMKELGKLNTVFNEMDRNSINILGICETNWTNKGSFRTHDNKQLIFTGKDEGEGYSHGIAIILSKETSASLLGYN